MGRFDLEPLCTPVARIEHVRREAGTVDNDEMFPRVDEDDVRVLGGFGRDDFVLDGQRCDQVRVASGTPTQITVRLSVLR